MYPVSETVLRSESMRRALGITMLVPAGPSRAHLALLKGAPYYMSNLRIAALSGLSEGNLSEIHGGYRGPSRSRMPVDKVHRDTEAAILGVEPEEAPPVRGGGKVSPVGTRRRLQALAAIGFPMRYLSVGMGWGDDPHGAHHLVTGRAGVKFVQHSTHVKACRVYDELSGKDPAALGVSPIAVGRAKASAARHGYAPPQCWDPDTIDDPDAHPEWTGRCGTVFGWLIHGKESIPVCGPCADAYSGGSVELSPGKLRAARARTGMSVTELAERAGLNRDTVGSWEAGLRVPRWLADVDRLAVALDVTLEEITEWL